MIRYMMAGAFALCIWAPSITAATAAETIKLMIMQEDDDPESIERDTRIQRSVLNAFNQALSAPSSSDIYRKYGIEGMDVYDEKMLTMSFDRQGRTRRQDTELISVAREVRNPRLDVLVLYTLYAKGVKAPYADFVKLQMSMSYRALDVRSGRVLGGENLDLDRDGEALRGCAAGGTDGKPDPHCVKEFVAERAERLVRDAGNTLAIQLAALSKGAGGSGERSGSNDAGGAAGSASPTGDGADCATSPRSYLITFRGMTDQDVRYLVKRMEDWNCHVSLTLEDSRATETSYAYKVRATDAKLKRNIEVTMERLQLEGDVETRGNNELLVKAIPIRRN
jgi:hypothetical protein